jgi:hypothetical protein
MIWPPQFVQYCRPLLFVFIKRARALAPFVTLTFSGFHKVKALTGAADHDRQELQWQ